MRTQTYRIPDIQIQDLQEISIQSGVSRSQLVRFGINTVINDFYKKEQIKSDQNSQYKEIRK